MHRAGRISGRVVFEGSRNGEVPDSLPLSVNAERLDTLNIGAYPIIGLGQSGEFRLPGLPDGRYSLSLFAFAHIPWYLQSMAVGGKVADEILLSGSDIGGVVLTATDSPSQLRGTVRDDAGRLRSDASVYLFAADRARRTLFGPWRRVFESTTAAGGFSFPALLAGEYLAAARIGGAPANWTEDLFLDRLANEAVHVTIADRGARQIELKVANRTP
jgi:hypothetical protein